MSFEFSGEFSAFHPEPNPKRSTCLRRQDATSPETTPSHGMTPIRIMHVAANLPLPVGKGQQSRSLFWMKSKSIDKGWQVSPFGGLNITKVSVGDKISPIVE